MISRTTLRMQFSQQDYSSNRVIEQVLDTAQRARINEVMLFYYAEDLNDGHETIDEIREWIKSSRPLIRALKDAGVAVSLNPWNTLLHADRGRRLKSFQTWQTMVDPKGKQASAQICPLDPGWRAYIADVMQLYADEGFNAVWIDDDFRFHNHAPLSWGGCFCPLHIKEFNRRTGENAGREAIVKACTGSGQPHPWRQQWLDMWDETQRDLISTWRDILESGGVRLGLMSSDIDVHSAEGRDWPKWWSAIAKKFPPLHRPHYCSYGETLGRGIPSFIAKLDRNRVLQPDNVDSGPEIDNGFYGPWNKPYSETSAQIALAYVLGSTHINLTLHDFLGNDFNDDPGRIEFLNSRLPMIDWLADEFPMSLKSTGVGIPFRPDASLKVHTDGSGTWNSLICPSRLWPYYLGAAGIAFQMRESDTINAIAGTMAWSISENDLKKMLSRSVLLDGIAADILVQRGFGAYIGYESGCLTTHDKTLYSIERGIDPTLCERVGAMMGINNYEPSLFMGKTLTGARIVSEILDPKLRTICPGVIVFENVLGGRIAVLPLSIAGVGNSSNDENGLNTHISPQRISQLRSIVRWLDTDKQCGTAAGGAWIIPQFLMDKTRRRGVIWNGSVDPVSRLSFEPPKGWKFKRAVRFDQTGVRHDIPISSQTIKLGFPMNVWDFVVLLEE